MNTTTTSPTAVLVHGAFADASGWDGIIRELLARGYSVVAPANPLRGIHSDAAAIRFAAGAVDGPVVLVGHSYGGAVITQAAQGLDNLAGLVYVAAFAPAAGETVASVQEPFPQPLLASTVRPTPYDAIGAAGGPDLVIDGAGFRETFAADLPEESARVMAVSQRPLAAAAAGEPLTHAGWTDRPSWYLVSTDDHAIAPEAQRFMAKRMGAVTEEIAGSHVAFIAHPAQVASFIARALDATA
ncbi:alpha/beta hydrolase [Microbacterium trichothecenolyticum]|jgi:pimeloyl-ACP methyl ester carboxylesterase|uniref:alpha/beta hydrolase n=1 Tax=Microbacterium trichothecenolyticum TaxID=69370 RepID=UPI001C6E6196|nr:alpha/beta hydrolase [Microbacterium trichothecenolyticum]MBW9121208.1 alpha/beta hydrolase [Microbacterium trichothecenolyticum]